MALVLLVLTPALAGTYKFGAIWDGEKVWKDACISTDGDRIQSVGPCAGATVDLSRFTAIPGLIDAHTHMTYVLDNPVSQSGRGAAVVFLSQENARKTLETGVTTVRNLGAADYADIAMRDLINRGLMIGPRMLVSGYGLHHQPRPHQDARDCRWRGGSAACGEGADRRRSGLGQNVRVDGIRPRRDGVRDIHL
jgi:imidazolonepropionase-like amidohydrolase